MKFRFIFARLKKEKKRERNARKQSQRINYESCPSPAHLTGVIGASRVSRHARKRAILVRILLAEDEHSDDRDRFFGSLVRGKLISFIRGDNGGERERERETVDERGARSPETSFFVRASAKFYFGRVPLNDYPYRENMEVKGASRKTDVLSLDFSRPLRPQKIAISRQLELQRPHPSYQESTFSISMRIFNDRPVS